VIDPAVTEQTCDNNWQEKDFLIAQLNLLAYVNASNNQAYTIMSQNN
jgi:hypothetical protein